MALPANDIAESLGDKRLTNMVMLGALLANQPVLPLEALEKALAEPHPGTAQEIAAVEHQGAAERRRVQGCGVK